MSDPIILGDQIIWLAKEWRDKCQEQRTANWTEPHRHYIGEAALLSPVDEGERKLVLYLSEKFGESKALTCPPGVRDNLGRPLAKDGFTWHCRSCRHEPAGSRCRRHKDGSKSE